MYLALTLGWGVNPDIWHQKTWVIRLSCSIISHFDRLLACNPQTGRHSI